MWLWESELRELGFRRKAERCWWCRRRFGLQEDEHLSLFSWSEQSIPDGSRRAVRYVVELTEFHVTLPFGHDNIHFYYHERLENEWSPGGHTSSAEVRRLGLDPAALRERADAVAAEFVAALRGAWHPHRD